MSNADESQGLRARKKRALRQHISDSATELFIARGFEQVTVDEVAVAAGVSKMTVFNYFPRKEDLFFDRTDAAHELLRSALGGGGQRSPLAALRALARHLVESGHPVAKVNRDVAANWKVVTESPALRARAFDLLEELERELGRLLAVDVGAPADDPTARLLAATLLGAWRVAFREALRRQRSASKAALREVFLELLERGFAAATAAARGTAYA
ncbi:MAG TPA: TetR family transcriptional regulator [Polyangiaceae bacterium]|nr:TetR family transcriptional regulator [Polyangiaceae bacterium]